MLDDRSFAFDVSFLAGDQVGCALMEDGVFRLAIYDRRTGKRLRHVYLGPGQDWLHAMAVDPKRQRLAVGFRRLRKEGTTLVARGSVDLYHLATGRLERRYPVPTPVRDLVWQRDGSILLATEAQYVRRGEGQVPRPGTAQVCQLSTTRGIRHCVADHADTVSSVVALPGGGLVTGSWDRTIRVRKSLLDTQSAVLRTGGHVNALAVDQRSRLAVATSHRLPRRGRKIVLREQRDEHRRTRRGGDAVELWDLATRKRLWSARPHGAQVAEVALTPGGEALASGSWDWTVAVFRHDGSSRAPHLAVLRPFSQIITGLDVHPASRTLAVAAWSEHRSSAPSCLLVRY